MRIGAHGAVPQGTGEHVPQGTERASLALRVTPPVLGHEVPHLGKESIMIRTVAVDTAPLRLLGLTVEPKTDFVTKQQKKSADGTSVWTVTAYSVAEKDTLRVTIAAQSEPELIPGQPVSFVNLSVGTYADGQGRALFYWNAEAIA